MLFILGIALLALDQWTKDYALNHLMGKEKKVLIDKLLEFTYVENRGAAFGILQGKSFLFIVITLFTIIGLLYFLISRYNTLSNLLKLSIILITSGAIGNLIDRIVRGYVVDFIFVRFWGLYDFPVFNIADMCVVGGAFLLIIILIFTDEIK